MDGLYSLRTHTSSKGSASQYSVNPFFMTKTKNGWMGVLLNNAAAQDWNVFNDPIEGMSKLTVRASGGIGEAFILLGESAEQVVRSYHQDVVGKPMLPP